MPYIFNNNEFSNINASLHFTYSHFFHSLYLVHHHPYRHHIVFFFIYFSVYFFHNFFYVEANVRNPQMNFKSVTDNNYK